MWPLSNYVHVTGYYEWRNICRRRVAWEEIYYFLSTKFGFICCRIFIEFFAENSSVASIQTYSRVIDQTEITVFLALTSSVPTFSIKINSLKKTFLPILSSFGDKVGDVLGIGSC